MTAEAPTLYLHANALLLGEKGLLLRGPSGSGKSALTLALISRVEAQGDFARLVGDDRVGVGARHGRLVARPHPAIAGVLEIRGLGLTRVAFEAACVLHAVVDICGSEERPARCPEPDEKIASICGVALPRLVAKDCTDVSVARILFFLQGIMTICH
ncbi:HPr kinase/phosphorylase [Methylocystis sp. JAN1]|uniref:HPr kinase/phosphorylase n=1 Tax=Methylocystis sp. JAN1 TaxID=3397211 RepID=UPI003FA23970